MRKFIKVMKALSDQNRVKMVKLLPKTNCRKCEEPTCMVFAARVAEGAKGIDACEPLASEQRLKLENYLSRFNFVD